MEDLLSWTPERLADKFRAGDHLDENILGDLLNRVRDVFLREENVLFLSRPITVIGDIHGQIHDMFQIFDNIKKGALGTDQQFLFLGDYVDRGYQSIETFAFLAFLKIKYPDRVWLLRGNHESRQVNQTYGLYMDCISVYGHGGVWNLLNEIFDTIPVSAVVANQVFCVHGGLSPRIALVDQIFLIDRVKDIEDRTPMADLTWSDPENSAVQFVPNRRGNGYVFGPNQTKQFLQNNGLCMPSSEAGGGSFVLRSHQLAADGWQWFHDFQCAIVWSAPNYGYRQVNKAMVVDILEGRCERHLFEAHPDSDKKVMGDEVVDYFA